MGTQGIGWHTCDTPTLTKSTAKSDQQQTDSQPTECTGTRYINEFHSNLAKALKAIGRLDLSALVGALNIGDKERIPCQAADVLCWHAARFENAQEVASQDIPHARRYLKLTNRKGLWFDINNDLVSDMAAKMPASIAQHVKMRGMPNLDAVIKELQQERAQLDKAIQALSSLNETGPKVSTRRTMPAAARRRIAAAQRARWAKVRAKKK